jgi:hypothetical protein
MSEREGLIKTGELIQPGQTLSEDAIVRLKKQELDYLIARVGLQGTLWGAWACLVVIVLIVLSPTFTERNIIEGWEIVAIVAVMVVSIVFYGAFIFDRALTTSAKMGPNEFEMTARSGRDRLEDASQARPERRAPTEANDS